MYQIIDSLSIEATINIPDKATAEATLRIKNAPDRRAERPDRYVLGEREDR